jgi:hypothetical protein
MHLNLALALLATLSGDGVRSPPLVRPAILNIGYVCRWEARCMKKQERAMRGAVKYVRKYRPPAWKLQLCNRNASRGRSRVDWIGMNNCIRNPNLRPLVRRQGRRS